MQSLSEAGERGGIRSQRALKTRLNWANEGSYRV